MSIKNISSWSPQRSCQRTVLLDDESWTTFPVKCQVPDSKFITELHSSSVSLPQIHSYTYTHFFSHSLSLHDGFSSTCWTDELNKNTLKHTRREIRVDGGWLFIWCWLYFDLKLKLSLNVLMCSCAALYWQWSPATVIIDFFQKKMIVALI